MSSERTRLRAHVASRPGARRDNGLNLVRLALALLVMVSHSHPLTGTGPDPEWSGQTYGTWAVIGFFALSGFLITGSRIGTTMGSYLIRRIARIYPGFLACLVVTILVFAPVAFAKQHGTLIGYLTTPDPPLNYLINNVTLKMFSYGVGDTLSTNPYPGAWDGSLWTLYYEFACYVIVGLLLTIPFVHRRPVLLVLAFAVAAWLHADNDLAVKLTNGHPDVTLLLPLLPYFLGGGVVWVLRDFIPLHWYVAVPAIVAWVLVVQWQPTWGGQAAAPLLTIALLWLGQVVVSPRWVQRNDISYGCYVYAFPMQQLAVLFGIGTTVATNLAVAGVATVALAMLSWFCVERPAMRAMRGSSQGVDVTLHHDRDDRDPATPRVPAQA